MTRWNLGLALALGGLLAACQSTDKNAAELQQKNQELEKRVAELEGRASPSPAVAATATPEPVWEAPAPVAPRPAPRAASRASAPAHVPSRPMTPSRTSDAPIAGPLIVSSNRNESNRSEPDRVSTESDPVSHPAENGELSRRDEPIEREERVNIPAGTQLSLVLETPLSSEASHTGDRVEARVERATSEDGRVLLPGGTVLKGHVLDAQGSGRVSGKARVVVAFDQIVVRGRTQRLDTTQIEAVAGDSHGRDAAIIGGGTAAGAIIGGIAGGGKGAGKGAIIGGLAGAGAVLGTKGKEIELPAGSRWTVRVKDGVRF
jgi:hypothetical protein